MTSYNFTTNTLKQWKVEASCYDLKILGKYLAVATGNLPTRAMVFDITGFMESDLVSPPILHSYSGGKPCYSVDLVDNDGEIVGYFGDWSG